MIELTKNFTLALTLAIFTSCSALKVPFNQQAFGKAKTYAIVSIYADKQIAKEGDSKTTAGAIKALAGKGAFAWDSSSVLNKSVGSLEAEFAKSGHYRLYPHRKLTRHSAYRHIKDYSSDSVFNPVNVATGYKPIFNPEEAAGLAKKLGVDGAITVHITYQYKFWGHTMSMFGIGLGSTGENAPIVKIDAIFVDRDGNIAWHLPIKKTMTKGVGNSELAKPKQMEPLFVDATRKVAAEVMRALDDRFKNG